MGQIKVWPKDEHAKDVVMNHGDEIKKLNGLGKTIPQLAVQFSVDPKVIRQALHDYWPRWKEEPEAEAPKTAAEVPAKADPVNHPAHYTRYSREVIELTEHCSFCLGNAFKYILRAPFKGRREEDIDKSMWYLNRYFRSACEFSVDPSYGDLVVKTMPFVLDLMEWKEYRLCSYFVDVIRASGTTGPERRKAWLKFKELAENAKKVVEEEEK